MSLHFLSNSRLCLLDLEFVEHEYFLHWGSDDHEFLLFGSYSQTLEENMSRKL